jgi:hypothetical protein
MRRSRGSLGFFYEKGMRVAFKAAFNAGSHLSCRSLKFKSAIVSVRGDGPARVCSCRRALGGWRRTLVQTFLQPFLSYYFNLIFPTDSASFGI